MTDKVKTNQQAIQQLTKTLDAMHLAQLTAFAFTLPPLYFCREYLTLDDQSIIEHCQQRLLNLMQKDQITLQQLTQLLLEKEYFNAYEAHLRVAPASIE